MTSTEPRPEDTEVEQEPREIHHVEHDETIPAGSPDQAPYDADKDDDDPDD